MKNSVDEGQLTFYQASLSVVGLVACATLAECTFRIAYDVVLRNMPMPGYSLIYIAPTLLFAFCVPAFGYMARLPESKFIVALTSLVVMAFTLTNFRGSHRWLGFYDVQEYSRWPLVSAFILSVLVGFALKNIWPKMQFERYLIIVCVLSLGWVWIDALRRLNLVTSIPYTRHIAMSILIICLIGVVSQQIWSKNRYE